MLTHVCPMIPTSPETSFLSRIVKRHHRRRALQRKRWTNTSHGVRGVFRPRAGRRHLEGGGGGTSMQGGVWDVGPGTWDGYPVICDGEVSCSDKSTATIL
ncbi:hypothetical protein PoB_002562400 [Plakobranchus ocellatus]|uniref:Uncharacterized protein n=1 Tax=Plakobranchus ocellatus TaxID=259542 RepID=A0AAV3ZUV7_9GAST|nr:hypothetical protein PoB_002562400 [Plakobranchus ocellatus]